MSPTDLPLPMLIALGLMAYVLITCSFHVLAHRAHMRIRRHNLLVEIQTRRLEYERQLLERQRALSADYDPETNVDILDDMGQTIDPVAGQITPQDPADATPRQAA